MDDQSGNESTLAQLFLNQLRAVLNSADIHINDDDVTAAQTNSLSITKNVLGIVYPRTTEQLKSIVQLAGVHKIALYPVSQGKNIGYGEMTPYQDNQLVVGLKHLNKIIDFDSENGEVVVEPGVTQKQLATYLKENNAKYWCDVTGASPDASIIGNTLEAGFGHTPIGDHRKHVLQMEVLLADGTTLKTAEMPGLGPDLAQLFIQSNFAIVTQMRIPLFPIPEETISFALSFKSEAHFLDALKTLTELRKDGTIQSLVHTGNATRALMTGSTFPKDMDRAQVLDESACLKILNTKSVIKFGAWSMVGGLYGYADDVKNKQARLKRAVKKYANVKFFTETRIHFIDGLLNSKVALKVKALDLIRGSFSSLKALDRIIRGQPSYHPSENIFWRVSDIKNLGLIWHAPVVPATKEDVSALMTAARKVYADFKFEMPVTLTLINAKYMTSVFNISYDKSSVEETSRAKAAYAALSEATYQLGYHPYRAGIGSDVNKHYSDVQQCVLEKIKLALDPNNTVAPGRYGINLTQNEMKKSINLKHKRDLLT